MNINTFTRHTTFEKTYQPINLKINNNNLDSIKENNSPKSSSQNNIFNQEDSINNNINNNINNITNTNNNNVNLINNNDNNLVLNDNTNRDISDFQKIHKKENQRFNIIIRIRPKVENDMIELTTEEELKPCIFKKSDDKILLRNEKTDNDYEMTFDKVFNEKSDQESLYLSFGEKLIKDIFKGYNGTILAYGQTGSGKSYTIFGKSLLESDKQTYTINQGLVQRAIHQIFEYKNLNKGKKNINVYISFMQVYLNQITDLLNEKNADIIFNAEKPSFKLGKESKNLSIENSLQIGHDKNKKAFVKNLIIKEVENEQKLLVAIENGINCRMTAQTILNKTSSRSHAILQIIVKQRWIERIKNNTTNEITDNLHNLKGILTVVDLAGSESIKRTGSEGINQDEAKEINKSISALGRVIEELSRQSKYINNNNKNYHISYRDSKLTEILSECLGGNSKTYIIACVSPFTANCEETYSTLQFASRAMIIKTQPKKNEKIDSKKFSKDINGNNNNNNEYGNKIDNNKKKLFGNGGNLLNSNNNNNNFNINKNIYKNKNENNNNSTINNLNLIDNNINNNNINNLNKEDFEILSKKFYSVILYLQDELGKLIVKNYSLEQENNYLKEQINNLQ